MIASEWLKTHGPGDRTLTQGLKVLIHLRFYCYSNLFGNFKFHFGTELQFYRTSRIEEVCSFRINLDILFAFQGDPTYLVVEKDRTLATYGINAVCTHLGCVVPFNSAENKFICPCHGSQYNDQGRVVRGPAPLVSSLLHFYHKC